MDKLKLVQLCSILGFEVGRDFREAHALLDYTKNFLVEFERRGHSILPDQHPYPHDAQLCATKFLEENERGSALWPQNSVGVPTWPKDYVTILMSLTYIFNHQAREQHQNQKQKGPLSSKEVGSQEASKRPSANSIYRLHAEASNSGQTVVSENVLSTTSPPSDQHSGMENIPLNDANISLLSMGDPESILAICRFLSSLDPKKNRGNFSELSLQWLGDPQATWSDALDRRLLYYMHDRDLYFHLNPIEDDASLLPLIRELRKGTDIEARGGVMEFKAFKDRIVQRIVFHTEQFLGIDDLEYAEDGRLRKKGLLKEYWVQFQQYLLRRSKKIAACDSFYEEIINMCRPKPAMAVVDVGPPNTDSAQPRTQALNASPRKESQEATSLNCVLIPSSEEDYSLRCAISREQRVPFIGTSAEISPKILVNAKVQPRPQCENLVVPPPIPPCKRRKLSSHQPEEPQSLFPVPNGNKISTPSRESSPQTTFQVLQESQNDINHSSASQTCSSATVVPDTEGNIAMGEVTGNATSSSGVIKNSSLYYRPFTPTKIPIAPDASGEDSLGSTAEAQSIDVIVPSDITQLVDTREGTGGSESFNNDSSTTIGWWGTLSHPSRPQDISNIYPSSSKATFVTSENLATQFAKPEESIVEAYAPLNEFISGGHLRSRPPNDLASASPSQELEHEFEIAKSTASSGSDTGFIDPGLTSGLYLDREQRLEGSSEISSTYPELPPHNGPFVTMPSECVTTGAEPNDDRPSPLPVGISLDSKANSERLENCSISSSPSSILSSLSRRFPQEITTFVTTPLPNTRSEALSHEKPNSSSIPPSTTRPCGPDPDPSNSNLSPQTSKTGFLPIPTEPPIYPESPLPSRPPIPAVSPIAEPTLTRLTIPVQKNDPSSSYILTPELDISNSNITPEASWVDLPTPSATPTPIVSIMKGESNESSAPTPVSYFPTAQIRQRYSSPRTLPLIPIPHFKIYIQASLTQPISFNFSLPSEMLASSKLPLDFFTLYIHQSNLALSTLETLTFILPFAENIKFVVHKNWTEREWTQFRRRLRGLVEIALEKDEDVEVWIEIGDTKRIKFIKGIYAGL